MNLVQVAVFLLLTLAVAVLTYYKCRDAGRSSDSSREYFLAGNSLSWMYIAGSLTLTNISTDTLVGMNGAQNILVAWWELSAVLGLIILAKVLLPIYYRYQCTTTTELLEIKYNSPSIRTAVSLMFLFGNIFIYLPVTLYTGSLFVKSLLGIELSQVLVAAIIAAIGAIYAIFGGLRAVAVSDTFNGVGLLLMGLLVVVLSLMAINFDFSGIPADRLSLIGGPESDIPWTALLTGMIFVQVFYWGTNQNITQRALAGKSLKEAQKGVYAAAVIRLVIIPIIVVLPGIVAFKLYGDIGDHAYGTLVKDVLPPWLSGAYAAVMLGAILSTYNSNINASASLYVCDLHSKYFNNDLDVKKVSTIISIALVICSVALVPIYMGSESIIALVQQLNGLLSMPILAAFLTGILFRDVRAAAIVIGLCFGVLLYAGFTWLWTPLHYIHLMFITLMLTIGVSLLINRWVYKHKAKFSLAIFSSREETTAEA